MRVRSFDVRLDGGRVLRAYDTGPGGLPVVWQHGTPNIGSPPEPLFAASERLGIRWVSYDRPGYGGSSPVQGRDVASAADDVGAVADALGLGRFAVMGHSGGGSHALACAAALGDRVVSVVGVAGLAPYDAEGLDWFKGMTPSGMASLRAAVEGRTAKERHEAEAEYDPEMFTPADHQALGGDWSWFQKVVGPAVADGPGGLIDDDLSYVAPWGCDLADITAPVMLAHGGQDRIVPSSHGDWLAQHCPAAELRRFPNDGHISVLNSASGLLDWIATQYA